MFESPFDNNKITCVQIIPNSEDFFKSIPVITIYFLVSLLNDNQFINLLEQIQIYNKRSLVSESK